MTEMENKSLKNEISNLLQVGIERNIYVPIKNEEQWRWRISDSNGHISSMLKFHVEKIGRLQNLYEYYIAKQIGFETKSYVYLICYQSL